MNRWPGLVHAQANPFFLSRNALRSKILEVQRRASSADWDGEGAVSLDQETVGRATQFVDCLPAELSDPDVDASPHGMIDFEWTLSREVMLSVSVCPDGTIAFAARFPEGKMSGTMVWSKELPEALRVAFHRLQRECDPARSI